MDKEYFIERALKLIEDISIQANNDKDVYSIIGQLIELRNTYIESKCPPQ